MNECYQQYKTLNKTYLSNSTNQPKIYISLSSTSPVRSSAKSQVLFGTVELWTSNYRTMQQEWIEVKSCKFSTFLTSPCQSRNRCKVEIPPWILYNIWLIAYNTQCVKDDSHHYFVSSNNFSPFLNPYNCKGLHLIVSDDLLVSCDCNWWTKLIDWSSQNYQ